MSEIEKAHAAAAERAKQKNPPTDTIFAKIARKEIPAKIVYGIRNQAFCIKSYLLNGF